MPKIEGLQYKLSNGDWENCDDRTDEFLAACVRNGGVENETEAITKLTAGEMLRNWPDDWNSVCRVKPVANPMAEVEMVECDCGHTIDKLSVMNASSGTSCPDCYID